MEDLEQLKYPIGKFQHQGEIGPDLIRKWIDEIAALPENLHAAVAGLTDAQFNTPYRPGGWTVRQVTHHIGDSHLNSYIRFKWALTEDRPVIKAYNEQTWANLPDYQLVAIADTLHFIAALHSKWVVLLKSLSEEDWQREFIHPETGKPVVLNYNLGSYAWHGKHHVAHITSLRQREKW